MGEGPGRGVANERAEEGPGAGGTEAEVCGETDMPRGAEPHPPPPGLLIVLLFVRWLFEFEYCDWEGVRGLEL